MVLLATCSHRLAMFVSYLSLNSVETLTVLGPVSLIGILLRYFPLVCWKIMVWFALPDHHLASICYLPG